MGDDDVESKVVFDENGETRALRGRIIDSSGDFITLERRDGKVQIAKRCIIKIEYESTL